MEFNTSRPNHITYTTNHLNVEVLGGIKLYQLANMRATLKITKLEGTEDRALRHNIDLYNHSQVEKLVRITAEQLEIGTSIIRRTLLELTEQLEQYRLAEQDEDEQQRPHKKVLSPEEKEAALALLTSKDLLQQTNALIEQSGVIGENLNRLIMFIIFTSRKTAHPLHCISLGSSGAGKTHLQSKVAELMPEEDVLEVTDLSENAFYYFGKYEIQHKLLLIEDLDGAVSALYPIREMKSKQRITKTVVQKNTRGETKTIHLRVEGPVCIAGCTTKERIYEDNANRSFLLYIDESPVQDERIMNYQRKLSAGTINLESEATAREVLKNAQRLLEPIKVINPYAEQLQIPTEVFKPRRTNAHYLQFIEAITFYHQHQRKQQVNKQTGEIAIKTTLEDIAAANELLKKVLLRKSDALSGACRNYFQRLKKWLSDQQKSNFSNAEIRRALRLPKTTHWRYHKQLLDNYYIRTSEQKDFFELTDAQEYEKLQARITSALDNCLEKISSTVPMRSKRKVKPTKQTVSTY